MAIKHVTDVCGLSGGLSLYAFEFVAVAPEVMPWGTHAYIIGARQAERMALTAELMVARSRYPTDDFHATAWQLDGEDIKIDHYLSVYYSDLTPKDDRRRCSHMPAGCNHVHS